MNVTSHSTENKMSGGKGQKKIGYAGEVIKTDE